MKRKKIYLALVLALLFIFSINASAEEGYTPGINSYINDASEGAKGVLIYKGTEKSDITSENIYYVNQCDEVGGFSNLNMLMKLDAPAGVYTVLIDGVEASTFEISDAQAFISGASEVDVLGTQLSGDNTYSVAIGFEAEMLLSDASAITMVIGDTAYTTNMYGDNSIINWIGGHIYTEGEKLMFAIQIDGIGAEYITEAEDELTPDFKLYIK